MAEYSFVVEGKPIAKQRPRLTRRGKAYTPQRTKDAEANVAAHYDGPHFEGEVGVDICFEKDSIRVTIWDSDYVAVSMRGDLDNLAKTVLDGLNGVAWVDDKQVKYLCVYMAER